LINLGTVNVAVAVDPSRPARIMAGRALEPAAGKHKERKERKRRKEGQGKEERAREREREAQTHRRHRICSRRSYGHRLRHCTIFCVIAIAARITQGIGRADCTTKTEGASPGEGERRERNWEP
jgi:hypothetical protein